MRTLIWSAALCVIAIVAVFAQLDRQSRYSPSLAQWVPHHFASFSLVPRLGIPNSDASKQDMLRQASALVARRPIPAEHQRLLAQAQLNFGWQDRSAQTIQRAGRHGWRDAGVQQAMLVLAVQAGDDRQAAVRLAAMWALSADREQLGRYAPMVLQRAAARQEFATVLVDARWKRSFLANGLSVLPPQTFADTLSEALKAGAVFDCERLNRARQSLSANAAELAAPIAQPTQYDCQAG